MVLFQTEDFLNMLMEVRPIKEIDARLLGFTDVALRSDWYDVRLVKELAVVK